MKILHTVEFYHPSIGGMQEVVKQISERLSARGHTVTVATSHDPTRISKIINGVNIKDFKISGNVVRGIKGDQNKYINFLLKEDYDIITNFAAQQWASDLTFRVLNKINAKKVFVPTGFSGLFNSQFSDYFEKIPKFLNYYDSIVYLSNDYRDISFSREYGLNTGIIIPNGASEDEFSILKKDLSIKRDIGIKQDFMIVSIGTHTGAKGHDEAIQIFKELNINNSALVIIGNTMKGFSNGCALKCKQLARELNSEFKNNGLNRRIYILDLGRELTTKLLMISDLFLFTSNIECSPLVLFEAMAAGIPFATVDVGNTKEITDWSNGGFLLPTKFDQNGNSFADIKASANIIHKLLKIPSNLKKMGAKGRSSWGKKFTWAKITDQYEKLYANLLINKQPKIFNKTFQKDLNYSVVISSSSKDDLLNQLSNISEQTELPRKVIVEGNFTADINLNNYGFEIQQFKGLDLFSPKILLQVTSDISTEWITFLSSDCIWTKDRAEKINNVYRNSQLINIGLIHTNFNLNQIYSNKFDSYDKFDPFIRGDCTNLMIEKGSYPYFSNSFIKTELLHSLLPEIEVELTDEYLFNLIMILSSQKANFEYSYSKTILSNRVLSPKYLTNELKFINELVKRKLITQNRAEIWGSSLVNRVISNFPSTKDLRIIGTDLSKSAKMMLFKQKGGSLEKFVLARMLLNYKNTLLAFISSSKDVIFNSLRLIIRK